MRRLFTLSACVASGFLLASITGAFAGDDAPRDKASATALQGLVDLTHSFDEHTIYWPTAGRSSC